jgi:hypothetical protein
LNRLGISFPDYLALERIEQVLHLLERLLEAGRHGWPLIESGPACAWQASKRTLKLSCTQAGIRGLRGLLRKTVDRFEDIAQESVRVEIFFQIAFRGTTYGIGQDELLDGRLCELLDQAFYRAPDAYRIA